MVQPYCHERRVEFRDTDAAGIVHFSVFFTYMEEAEHALLRSLGLDLFLSRQHRQISFPRVAARCDYRRPLHFGETVTVETSVEKIGRSSTTYRFDFRRDRTEIANGQITTACCQLTDGGEPTSMEIPNDIREVLLKASS